MKNTSSSDRLSSTDGKTDFASRVKNLLSSSPLIKKRSMSLPHPVDSSRVFGVPLDVLVAREKGEVPNIVKKIVEYIESSGMTSEGIYRVNGNAKNIEKMKMSFDKVGDAQFPEEDIPAVAGVLKLFLRELPDGVVPNEKVREFVRVQKEHPHEPTPEALSELRQAIHSLPPSHYATLKYLIHHLSRVAKHTDSNKMTPVSLSIVFGPNLFHCGEGLGALQLQGYSNSTVCRMIFYHEVLFEGVEEVKVRKRSSPAKPRPYSEYAAEKKVKQNHPLSPIRSSSIDATSDLERSYSEKSIDEAILERSSSGPLSPASPSHLQQPPSPKTPPLRPPPPKFKKSPSKEKEVASPSTERKQVSEEEESPFHRQYAKRGLKFNPSSPESSPKSESSPRIGQSTKSTEGKVSSPVRGQGSPGISKKLSGEVLKSNQVSMLSSKEDESLLHTSSIMSSPGGSPPPSPTITPRSSRVVNSVIDESINQFLFQAPPTQTQPTPSDNHAKGPRADIYGLLLPENSAHMDSPKPPPVVKRHSVPNGRKLRHRTSALFGGVVSQESEAGPMEDMDVRILSVSPENKTGGVESRQGRLSELISRFEERVDGVDGDNVDGGGGDGVDGGDGDGVESGGTKKRKPTNKAFEMFEKKGIMIGMAGSSVPKVSFASTNTTISPSPSPSSSPTHIQTGSNVGSDDLTTVSKHLSTSTTGDEDVFTSSTHLTTPTPFTRDTLSTTVSDDVFISPVHSGSGCGQSTGDGLELDIIKREKLLNHAVLSRPRGPSNRRLPSRGGATPPSSSADKSNKDSTTAHNLTTTQETDQSDHSKKATPKHSLSPASETSSVAPEDQKRVEEGWCEGVEMVDGVDTPTPEQDRQQKELSHRIHVLKKQVKEFESQFISTHGHKPTGEERASVRPLIEEAHRLKRQLKSMESSSRHEDQGRQSASPHRVSQTRTLDTQDTLTDDGSPSRHPVTISTAPRLVEQTKPVDSIVDTSPVDRPVSSKPSRRATVDLKTERENKKREEVKAETLSGRAKSEGAGSECKVGVVEQSRLTATLNKLMSGLETRRRSSARPDDITTMSDEQLLQEKRDVQKALLQFEKIHGRPTSREDKETMRPLYDRYRLVKKLASTSGGEGRVKWSQAPSRHSLGVLESTADSLPSVTLLHSSTLGPSLPGALEHKSVLYCTAPTPTASGLTGGEEEPNKKQVMSDSELKKASLDELIEQNKLLLGVKKDIRIKLKVFETKFQAENGRSVEREDRGLMSDEYTRYKDIKSKLKIVASLMAKSNPQKTI